ncbi:MAG TPA: hypothetical protein VEI83_13360 [Acidimicrobiales bacterium]|nr:hypothetical protein [Acidimicrobiales bacterium]
MTVIAELVGAVAALKGLASDVMPVVERIRSGMRAHNDEVKKELSDKLDVLQGSLTKVGILARAADAYAETHEQLSRLLWLTERTHGVVKEHYDDCADRLRTEWDGSWRVIEALYGDIVRERGAVSSTMLARQEWYDSDDRGRVQTLLGQFQSESTRAQEQVETRSIARLDDGLATMIQGLRDADDIVRNTLFKGILAALEQLSS